MEMPGGLRALAAVAALSTAATFAMTTTTALHVAWPDAAFRLLALALGAAVLLAHARHLSRGQLTFMAGVMAASAASLVAAAQHTVTHWDDFMTWLPNATYIQADISVEDQARALVETAVERLGRLERSSSALNSRPPSSQRCHQRCAVAGETLKAAAAAFKESPSSTARTNASRPASPSLALACRYIRALLWA